VQLKQANSALCIPPALWTEANDHAKRVHFMFFRCKGKALTWLAMKNKKKMQQLSAGKIEENYKTRRSYHAQRPSSPSTTMPCGTTYHAKGPRCLPTATSGPLSSTCCTQLLEVQAKLLSPSKRKPIRISRLEE